MADAAAPEGEGAAAPAAAEAEAPAAATESTGDDSAPATGRGSCARMHGVRVPALQWRLGLARCILSAGIPASYRCAGSAQHAVDGVSVGYAMQRESEEEGETHVCAVEGESVQQGGPAMAVFARMHS